ncbi:MAG TPA: glycosyltransferase family 2 protein [Bacteroidia bacterium]|jgi:cellulose synthase/poly-beta-1,6-N-acetylglucosamine synthase-like glycosyltransferase
MSTALIILLKIIFALSALALLHTYFFYPLLLRLLSAGSKANPTVFSKEELPPVSILMAAYNEEQVIAEKIESILASDYPPEKIQVLIGSDNSSDRTNSIVKGFETKFPGLKLIEFSQRTGKVMIVNGLVQMAAHDILIITDANVIFDRNTIYQLVKHFKNDSIALVDTNMINRGLHKGGISVQEKTYIQAEVFIKNAEGRIWGAMMGPFGGCYALRKNHFTGVPANFLVDDFYINMRALEKGGKCMNEPGAKVYEDVSNELGEEFRRKVRIATGNFQNLSTFSRLLGKFNAISFCFFSHKVLRWIGPFFMISAFFSSLALASFPNFYFWVCALGLLLPIITLTDIILKSVNAHIPGLRFITHFISMNFALFIGFFKYLGGVRSSIWEPTKRNQAKSS